MAEPTRAQLIAAIDKLKKEGKLPADFTIETYERNSNLRANFDVDDEAEELAKQPDLSIEMARKLYKDDPAKFQSFLGAFTTDPERRRYEMAAYEESRKAGAPATAASIREDTLKKQQENRLRQEVERALGLEQEIDFVNRGGGSAAGAGGAASPPSGAVSSAGRTAAPATTTTAPAPLNMTSARALVSSANTNGPALTGAQQALYDAAVKAGFKGDAALRAVATAWAESPKARQGDWTDYNARGENSVGPWQINLDAHADKVPGKTMAEKIAYLQDVNNAAKIAFQVSSGGTDFSPWSVWHDSIKLADGTTMQVGAPARSYFEQLSGGKALEDSSGGLVSRETSGSRSLTIPEGWRLGPTGLEQDDREGDYRGTRIVNIDKNGNPSFETVGWAHPTQGGNMGPRGAWWGTDLDRFSAGLGLDPAAAIEHGRRLQPGDLAKLIQDLLGRPATREELASPPGGQFLQGDQGYLRNRQMIEQTGLTQAGAGREYTVNPFNTINQGRLNISGGAPVATADQTRQFELLGDIADTKSGKTLAELTGGTKEPISGMTPERSAAAAQGRWGEIQDRATYGSDALPRSVRRRFNSDMTRGSIGYDFDSWLRELLGGYDGDMGQAVGGLNFAGAEQPYVLQSQPDAAAPQYGQQQDMTGMTQQRQLESGYNELQRSNGQSGMVWGYDEETGLMGMVPRNGGWQWDRWLRSLQGNQSTPLDTRPMAELGGSNLYYDRTGKPRHRMYGNVFNMNDFQFADGGGYMTTDPTAHVNARTGDLLAMTGEEAPELNMTVPTDRPAADPIVQLIQQILQQMGVLPGAPGMAGGMGMGGAGMMSAPSAPMPAPPAPPAATPPDALRRAAAVSPVRPRSRVAIAG